jgi:hypothetical protein
LLYQKVGEEESLADEKQNMCTAQFYGQRLDRKYIHSEIKRLWDNDMVHCPYFWAECLVLCAVGEYEMQARMGQG